MLLISFDSKGKEMILPTPVNNIQILQNTWDLQSDPRPTGQYLIDFLEMDISMLLKLQQFLSNESLNTILVDTEKVKNTVTMIENIYVELSNQHPYISGSFADTYHEVEKLLTLSNNNINLDTKIFGYSIQLNRNIESMIECINLIQAEIDKILKSYNDFRLAMHFCLNENHSSVADGYNTKQRLFFYQHFISLDMMNISIRVKYYLSPPGINNSDGGLLPTEIVGYPINPQNRENIKKVLPTVDLELYEVYEADIQSACYLEFMKMVVNNRIIRKCKNCKKFFMPSGRSDTLYCERKAPQSDRSCREVGAANVYKKKVNGDPLLETYNKVYKKYNARVRYKKMTQQEFCNWSGMAREMRDKVKTGEISPKLFEQWLNDN